MLNELYDKTGESLVKFVILKDFRNVLSSRRDKAEIFGCGRLGLAYAVNQYDKSKGCGFVTFACLKIKQSIINYLRQKRNTVLLIPSDMDLMECREDVVGKETENIEFIRQLLLCLTEEEEKIVIRIFWNDESEREIAKSLEVSKTYVHTLKSYAIQKMKDKGMFLINGKMD